jgi:Ca2+-binding RTX toxin-like protein
VAVETSGSILVSDHEAGMNFRGAIFRVDPSSGTRTVLSDFGDSSQGALGANPLGFAIEASGNLLVVDFDAGTSNAGAVFRVDISNGSRSLISDFDTASPKGLSPIGIGIDASGNALVSDFESGTSTLGALFFVSASGGIPTLVSDFGNASQGTTGVNSVGVLPLAAGNVLVVDDGGQAGRGLLFSVNPSTGFRTVISDFGNATQGERGTQPSRLALVPLAPGTPTCNGQLPTSGCTVNGVASQSCSGTEGDDTISGTGSADVILGLAGNDTITGAAGGDLICGGDGNDTLMGSLGPDQLFGEAGDDTLRGGRGGDAVDGGDGTDTCFGGLGSRDGAANCETLSGVP